MAGSILRVRSTGRASLNSQTPWWCILVKPKFKDYKNILEKVLEWVAAGKTLRDFCRQEGMPSSQAIYAWMAEDESYKERFARARESGAEVIAQECLEIADDARNDWMERLGKDGQPIGWQLNGDHVQRSKLMVETRLKLLAKWFPQKYGDKQTLEHTGEGGGPVQMQVITGLTRGPGGDRD